MFIVDVTASKQFVFDCCLSKGLHQSVFSYRLDNFNVRLPKKRLNFDNLQCRLTTSITYSKIVFNLFYKTICLPFLQQVL